MDYNERVDVVDLILQVLKEHERNLDSLVLQLGETVGQQSNTNKTSTYGLVQHKIVLRFWPEFREKCLRSDTVTFDFEDGQFKVIALKNDVFYRYFENLSLSSENKSLIEGTLDIYNLKLNCGLELMKKISDNNYGGNNRENNMYNIDPEEVKLWLSEQLKTDKRAIMFGWIEQ